MSTASLSISILSINSHGMRIWVVCMGFSGSGLVLDTGVPKMSEKV